MKTVKRILVPYVIDSTEFYNETVRSDVTFARATTDIVFAFPLLFLPVSTVRELLPSFSYRICLVHLYVETPQLRMASSLVEPARSSVPEPAPPF